MENENRANAYSNFPNASHKQCVQEKYTTLSPQSATWKVKVAVVDSGADTEHPDLKDRIVSQKDFVNGGSTASDDFVGHGTHITGIVAKNTDDPKDAFGNNRCIILLAKASDAYADGNCGLAVAEGIRWSVDNGAEVINVSLAGPDTRDLRNAVDYAVNKGALVVAAAGNQGTDRPVYPAAYPNVLAVAATDNSDQLACDSNYGTWVDLATLGENILSAAPGGGYRYQSGTSQASARVASLVANLLATGYCANEIRSRMKGRPWIPDHLTGGSY